ncbi:unnamed protein product [Ectocarpus sp. 12 AP-2014]
MLACIPFVGLSVAVLAKIMSSSAQEGSGHYSKAGGVLTGIRTVASLYSEEIEIERYGKHIDGAYHAGVKEGMAKGLGNGVFFASVCMSYALAFWFGTKRVADGGDRTGEDVLAAICSVLLGTMMIGQTAPGVATLNVARGAAVEVFQTLDRVPPIDSSSTEGLKHDKVDGQVVFDAVGFSYPARPNDVVYSSLSLDVPVRETLALVGPSGGGKSTMTKLLLRFYDRTSGSVKLDGVDMKSLNVAWFMQQISYVGQEPVLFAGTIALKIANGKLGVAEDESELRRCHAANAHEFIKSFPNGYKTGVGEEGFQLSRGQKQRIAIARAVIKDPAILLLDEATSALDSESEKVVQATLDKLHKEKPRTTVTIAHRLSTTQGADKIAVINKGVVELGTHKELLALKGVYHTLCTSQGGMIEEEFESEKMANIARQESSSHASESRSEANVRRQSSLASSKIGGDGMDISVTAAKEEEDKLPKPASRGRMWALNRGDWPWLLLGLVGAIVAGASRPTEGLVMAQGQVRHDISWFDKDSSAVGMLTSRLESEASVVRRSTGSRLAHTLQTAGTVLGLVFAWQIGLIAVASILLIAAAGVMQMAVLTGGFGDNDGLDGGGGAAGLLSSSLQGMTTVTAFNLHEKVAEECKEVSESSLNARKRRGLIAGGALGYSQAILFWMFALIFYVGAILVDDGTLEYDAFFTAIFAVIFGAFGAGQVGSDATDASEGEQAAAKFFRLTDGPLNVDPLSEEGAKLGRTKGALEFQEHFRRLSL